MSSGRILDQQLPKQSHFAQLSSSSIVMHYSRHFLAPYKMTDKKKQGIKRAFDDTADGKKNVGETEQPKADSSHHPCGKRLKSQQITVLVGSEKESFQVHESVLSSSPVLARLCSESAKSDGSSCISLPDETPDDIGLLFEFLYRDNFPSIVDNHTFNTANAEIRRQVSEELCQIYRLGHKYDLPQLKDCVVKKFEAMTSLKRFALGFLNAAQKMYGHLPDSDEKYSTFFLATAEKLFRKYGSDDYIRKSTEDAMLKGGRFARDLFVAQRKFLETQAEERRKTIAELSYNYKTAQSKREEDCELINKLVNHHADEHKYSDCGGWDSD